MGDNSGELRSSSLALLPIASFAVVALAGPMPLRAADPSALLTQARESRRLGNLDAAAQQLQQGLGDLPEAESARLRSSLHAELGALRLQQQRDQDAIGHFEEALRAAPGQGVVHYQAGIAYRRIGKSSKAAEHLDEAIRLGFRNTGVLFHLAGAHFASGQNAAGLGRCRELLSMNLTSSEFLFRLGRLLFQYFFYRDALQAFEAAQAISPQSHEARLFLALTNYLLNRHEETQRLLAPLKEDGGCAECSTLLASALAQQGRFLEAEALFRRTIERHPTSPHAYLNWSFVLLEQGRTAAAEARLDDLRRLGATVSPKAFYAVGRSSCPELEEQLGMEESLPSKNAERAQAYFELAENLGARHHQGTAVELLRLARRYEGYTPRLLYALAHSCLSLDPHGRVPIRILEKLILLDATAHGAQYLLGRALLRQGRTEESVASLRKAVELNPQSSVYHAEFGRALAARNTHQAYSDALEAFTEAARLDSSNAIARYELGKLLMHQDRFAEALQVLEEAIKAEPEFHEAYYVLGQLHIRTGERDMARKYLKLFHEKQTAAKARSAVGAGFASGH